ncbi:MAG TPA: hypothetical protein VJ831_02005 [Jatrophihabitantaceae bacterium]|nr:hypothetical protein [Jatrophihabitantaceae bacterium]
MTSALSGIAVERRRRLAATLGLFAVLFVTVGIVATTGQSPGTVKVFSAVSLTIAAFLALLAWGVSHSVKLDLDDAELDRAIDEAVARRGGRHSLCDCGHEHDYNAMHVRGAHLDDSITDDACSHDGTGADCAHDCTSCVMRTLRPSPRQTRAERLGVDSA